MGRNKRVVVTVALAAVVAGGLLLGPSALAGRIRAVLNSPWFPLVLVGLYVVRPFLAWPITALSAVVGYKYGLLWGVPIALLGAALSTFIPYAAMRYFEFDSGVLGKAAEESDHFFDATGDLRGTVTARVAPVPAEATSLAAGAAGVRPSRYVLGTLVGELPWAVAAVTIGHSMYRLSLSNVSYNPWLIGATLAAALVLVAGPAYKLVERRRNGDDSSEENPPTVAPTDE